MNGLITSDWAVSFVSILAALAVTPVLCWAVERVRSRRGALTGTYIALTQTADRPVLLAGIVRCRHVGAKLKGNIAARAQLTLGSSGNVERFAPAAEDYRFAGRARARQVLLSYWNVGRASREGGAMTMVLDVGGTAFRGLWCGTGADGQLISGPCLWVKASGEVLADLDAGQLAARADSVLRLIVNPWREPGPPPIRLDKLLDNAAARDALRRVEPGR